MTPNLDALAREGVRFENAFTCQPVCGPARACLQTGRWPTQTGCFINGTAPDFSSPDLLAKLFNRAGYVTAYVGKWHLATDSAAGINYETAPIPAERRGGWKDYWMASDVLGSPVVRVLDPKVFIDVKRTGHSVRNQRVYLAEYERYVEQSVIYDKEYRVLICIMRDMTEEEVQREKKENISRQTIEIADSVVDKQMRVVQEIASLLGETVAETKTALSHLKESIRDE